MKEYLLSDRCAELEVLMTGGLKPEYYTCKRISMVDTIQGAFGFFEAKKTSKKKIFIWWKRARRELSYDVVHLFIDLVFIGIPFDLYLSVGSGTIETHTLINNRKLFNEWITRKRQKQ